MEFRPSQYEAGWIVTAVVIILLALSSLATMAAYKIVEADCRTVRVASEKFDNAQK